MRSTESNKSLKDSALRDDMALLLHQHAERLKELRGLTAAMDLFGQGRPLEATLQDLCELLPQAWQYPEHTACRIVYDSKHYLSAGFAVTEWAQRQEFTSLSGSGGLIEIFYLKEFPVIDEGPFMKEERTLILNLARVISSNIAGASLSRIVADNYERIKELRAINKTSQIIALGRPIEETLQKICNILPASWQYPQLAAARISYEGKAYSSPRFKETPWVQHEAFVTIGNKKGRVELVYLQEVPAAYEGPFLKEERNLIINIARLIAGYLNSFYGRQVLDAKKIDSSPLPSGRAEYRESLIKSDKPLNQFFNKQHLDKYIYLDMMKYKVKEILFVATLYDAFVLENEDSFFGQFMGEIYQYSLFSLPRITAVSTDEQALGLLQFAKFDFAILAIGEDEAAPLLLAQKIKESCPDIPVFLLLNKKGSLKRFEEIAATLPAIDKLFTWNGDSQIFFAIVKSLEDRANVANDTKVGLVRVILLVEDSPLYYSRYLSILYSVVFGQIQQLISGEKNELEKISKMRSRPKILYATNYEEAIYIYNSYKEHLLGIISDVEFDKKGELSKTAGISFAKHVRAQGSDVPILLQSSEDKHRAKASKIGAGFVNKNSENLASELREFVIDNIGFGDFVFRSETGQPLAAASNLRQLETLLSEMPASVVKAHALKEHFSFWLIARGEIYIAKVLNAIKASEFSNAEDLRATLIENINQAREQKKKGRVLSFDESFDFTDKNIVSLAPGSLGGKGRGLAFINTLVQNIDFAEHLPEINIKTPVTAIIGTDEYVSFMQQNSLFKRVLKEKDYARTKEMFLRARLSEQLLSRLKVFAEQIRSPLAVRSSSLFEDSLSHPFAGIFDTYIIPNNEESIEERLASLIVAVKLVYASVFSPEARTYYKAVSQRIEEERMAVAIQELVGRKHGRYYYPNISGTAQSYNFYPVAHMSPEEGFGTIAIGLGTYVVEGGRAYRFSPRYPATEVHSTKDLVKTTQTKFIALDTQASGLDYLQKGDKAALAWLDIYEAEKHGSINHCVSAYNPDNDSLVPGTGTYGPRVVNFANILKYGYIPLAETIDVILSTVKEALGTPVEIEYAVDLTKDSQGRASFYLLQIKPLVGSQLFCNLDFSSLNPCDIMLRSENSMGNGSIETISEIVFVKIGSFDKLRTIEIAAEVDRINAKMLKDKKQYILMGPGRWGTQDPSVGIPVTWSQICNAKVIVELGLADFPLDASLGSHFFHNVTSMNIGYFSVQEGRLPDFIDWEKMQQAETAEETRYLKHLRFSSPLKIVMDGRKRKAVIMAGGEQV
jgi:hypothetical protein